ncbi:hypothetical protein [Mesorhizobium sp. LjNodule214]
MLPHLAARLSFSGTILLSLCAAILQTRLAAAGAKLTIKPDFHSQHLR